MVGNDSVRARILQAFVKKSQDEATKAVASLVSEQISNLRLTIEEKQKGGFRSNTDMSKVLHEVTEQIKQCEQLARNLQTSGMEKPSRGETSSRSNHVKSARRGGERCKQQASSTMLLRHTKSALSSVLRRSVPGNSSRSSNMSSGSSTRCSDSTYTSDDNSLLYSV
jgi:hypothetical protein